jgi:hypothetical protein
VTYKEFKQALALETVLGLNLLLCPRSINLTVSVPSCYTKELASLLVFRASLTAVVHTAVAMP